MAIAVDPTLEVMARIYREPAQGGPRSARFAAYAEAGKAGSPIHGYNPMTSKPVLPVVDVLLALDAEARLGRLANRTAATFGEAGDHSMHLTVATPGMWTDRLATEVEHRLLARDPGGVLWWFDDAVDTVRLDAEIVAQTVRLLSVARSGPPATLAAAVEQEGRALAAAGHHGRLTDNAADTLAVLGEDPHLSTQVAFLYGDASAAAMGFAPLGLGDREGYGHAVALHADRRGA